MSVHAGLNPAGSLHCCGCGRTDCGGCLPELDPPRYCARCGAWLATSVTPAGWTAECRRCGPFGP